MSDNPLQRTTAIANFLRIMTHSDLANLYNPGMEVQVNVAQGNGERVDGEFHGRKWHGWTDGVQTWKSFRIPYKANSNPEYKDKPIYWDLEVHAEGIGMTGWDWKNKQSKWVAYDFDAISGHSDTHEKKLTENQLREIRETVKEIDWVTVRHSTSGKGLHLYVIIGVPVSTQNHNEHAALSRAILGKLSAITGFDFKSKVDICGGNMWVWHRKMRGTTGLQLIKQGIPLTDIPMNWKDHIKVVKGLRTKSVPQFIDNAEVTGIENLFAELSGQRSRIPLDQEHRKVLDYLNECGASWSWDQDHNMLITHTYSLKLAHEELGLKGVFETIATGKEHGSDHNCFAYPMRNGAWSIRRYTPGVQEKDTWTQDGSGWTTCYLNKKPDLKTVARAYGAVEDTDGGFTFRQAEIAQEAAMKFGIHLNIPSHKLGKEIKLKEHKDGRLLAELTQDTNDEPVPGWLSKGKKFTRIYDGRITQNEEVEVGNYDDTIRHLVTKSQSDFGWVLKSESKWRNEPLTHLKAYLASLGLKAGEVNQVIGSCVSNAWTIVNIPFEDEYPGGRRWNRESAQLTVTPSDYTDNLNYPTWLSILKHCGNSLDEEVLKHPWAKANGILTGADYLKCWIASLFQQPMEQLPYLFFYSEEQNTGKSIFHEALSLLITHGGICRADLALTNPNGFNGELEHAILCVVEETDLRGKNNKNAYNRIKDWTTARDISIRAMYRQPYIVPNSTHWVQVSNELGACPIFPGDTRIVVSYVKPLSPTEMIPKKQILPMLQKEAPDFLAEILNLEIPVSPDRLNIPVISTREKLEAEAVNKTDLEVFIDEYCHFAPGYMISVAEFTEKFHIWLGPQQTDNWSKITIGRNMPNKFPKGRGKGNPNWHFGNISWEKPENKLPLLTLAGETLR